MVIYNNGNIVLTEAELRDIKIEAGAVAVETAAQHLPRAFDRNGRAQLYLLGVATGMRKRMTNPRG